MQHELARVPVQTSLAHPPHRDAPRAAVGPRAAGLGDPADQPIVFVIDDDDSVRRSLERLLRSVDLDVQTFSSAREFIDLPVPDRPACIVLDLRLPGPSGLELQESLSHARRETPILFLSGPAARHLAPRALPA